MSNLQNEDNKKSSVIVINASSSGADGNTELILKKISNDLNCEHVYLKDNSYAELREKIKKAKGIILGTGNYWSNHSHFLQNVRQYCITFQNMINSLKGNFLIGSNPSDNILIKYLQIRSDLLLCKGFSGTRLQH